MSFIFRHRITLLLGILLAVVYWSFFVNRAFVELKVHAPRNGFFKIYWKSPGKGFSEYKMARVRIKAEATEYSFFLTDLRELESLRIDPLESKGAITIKELVIRQPGLPPIRFSSEEDFSRLQTVADVERTEFTDDGWTVHSSGEDPRFELPLDLPQRALHWPGEMLRLGGLLLFVFLIIRVLQPLWSGYAYTTLMGIFALGLILCMAAVSLKDHHPDEVVHLKAATYYTSHWLPPPVDSPEIRSTYSFYGMSRLNLFDSAYFFAGKFAQLLELFQIDWVFALRFFNLTLFAILTCIALNTPSFRLIYLPLLLSPQIWYVFSYMNSDAFAVFIITLAAWQLADRSSVCNRFLRSQRIPWWQVAGLGVLVAMLFLVKKNFYFFTLFLPFFFIWRCIVEPFSDFRGMLQRAVLLCVIGGAIFGVRVGVDYYVNGPNKVEKMRAMQELTAKPEFKPSTELHKKHAYLYKRERGTSLKEFLTIDRWGEKTFRSGFGAYGYLTVSGSDSYYHLVRWTAVAGVLFMALSIGLRGGLSGNLLFGGAFAVSAALIAMSCYHAWTVDFQAQGRYLFPIAGIVGMVLLQTEKVYNQIVLRLITCSLFLLSVYSFVFVGLYGVAKYGWG